MREKPAKRPVQISLSLMMLLMVVFALISAGFFYASRIPLVRSELSLILHGEALSSADDTGRSAQIVFILFTLTSPLILAGLLSTGMSVLNWYTNRR